jgi:putative NADH-flavin reductase
VQFIEISRKIVLAARDAKVNCTIMVGGCGSLNVPGELLDTCVDSQEWWLAYRRGMADSPAHLTYMEERYGPAAAKGLKAYHDARVQAAAGKGTAETQSIIESHEKDLVNDQASGFIRACRATFMFFDRNTSFRWTFVSPPTLFRSGPRTGEYKVVIDKVPVKGDQNDGTNVTGRLHGIAARDLAIAIADESEKQSHEGKHWSPYGDISDQTPTSAYVTLDAVR